MKQQTAVEYLESIINHLTHNGGSLNGDYLFLVMHIRQAKAMEKEQIIKAWDKRGSTIVPRYYLEENINGEQYYNETYD